MAKTAIKMAALGSNSVIDPLKMFVRGLNKLGQLRLPQEFVKQYKYMALGTASDFPDVTASVTASIGISYNISGQTGATGTLTQTAVEISTLNLEDGKAILFGATQTTVTDTSYVLKFYN